MVCSSGCVESERVFILSLSVLLHNNSQAEAHLIVGFVASALNEQIDIIVGVEVFNREHNSITRVICMRQLRNFREGRTH